MVHLSLTPRLPLQYSPSLPILLLNNERRCFKPRHERHCMLEVCEYFGLPCADFMRAIYRKSGLGDETYTPPFIFQTDYEVLEQLMELGEAPESTPQTVPELIERVAAGLRASAPEKMRRERPPLPHRWSTNIRF